MHWVNGPSFLWSLQKYRESLHVREDSGTHSKAHSLTRPHYHCIWTENSLESSLLSPLPPFYISVYIYPPFLIFSLRSFCKASKELKAFPEHSQQTTAFGYSSILSKVSYNQPGLSYYGRLTSINMTASGQWFFKKVSRPQNKPYCCELCYSFNFGVESRVRMYLQTKHPSWETD